MNQVGQFIFIALIIALGVFLLWFFIFKVKHLKTPDVYCVDGGVKVGKSLVCVYLAIRQYRKNVRRYYIGNFFIAIINLFRKARRKPLKAKLEKPMLYSNMPLRCVKYNDLTKDIIYRRVRIPYRSVCLIDEASLVADAMSGMLPRGATQQQIKDFDDLCEALTLFLKLYGHFSRGGSLFWNSQAISDLHFSFRRVTTQYCFCIRNRKFPFFCLIDVREMVHSEDGDAVNTINQDLDSPKENKPLFISKRYYKYYDRYYLSALTDKLPLYVNYDVIKKSRFANIAPNNVLTLGKYKSIERYNKESQNA